MIVILKNHHSRILHSIYILRTFKSKGNDQVNIFFKAFDRHEGFYIDCHLDGIQKYLENTPLGMSLRDCLESVDVGRPTLTVDVPFHG